VLPFPEMEKTEGRICLPMSFYSVKFLIPFRCQMEMQGWNQRYASLKFLGDPPGDQRRGYQQADGIFLMVSIRISMSTGFFIIECTPFSKSGPNSF